MFMCGINQQNMVDFMSECILEDGLQVHRVDASKQQLQRVF